MFTCMFVAYFTFVSLFDFLFDLGSPSKNLFMALLNSGFMTIYFVGLLIHSDRKVRQIAHELTPESYNPKQQKIILLALPFEKVFELCKESLSLIKKAKIKTEDTTNERIMARTRSWSGNIIAYEIEKIGEHLTRVEITSQPAWRTVQFDNGVNLDNVQKVSEFLIERDLEFQGKQFEKKMGNFVERYLKHENEELTAAESYFVSACKNDFLKYKRDLMSH